MRADTLNTFRRNFGLGFRDKIHQCLADLGIGEDPFAVLAGEGPTRHA